MPKDLGGFLASKLRDDRLAHFWYLKSGWGAPTGTLRWTDYIHPKTGARYDNRDIDGSAQDWDSFFTFEPKGLQEGEQSSLTISDIEFNNADNTFTDRMTLSAGGARACTVTLWSVFFNVDDLITFDSKFMRFNGVLDRVESEGDLVRASLLTGKQTMFEVYPHGRYNAAHGYKHIPKPGIELIWGSSNYSAPAASPRQTGTGGGAGGEDIPPPGGITGIPRMQPIRANPRPPIPTGDGGGSPARDGAPRVIHR